MKKIKIDTDVYAEETFKTEIEAKLNAFKTLLSNLEEYVDVIDLKALYEAPEAYSKDSIIKEYASSYKRIKHDKLFDLIGFDLSELKKQSDIFKSIGHNFDSKTLEYTTPDFGIYAQTEEQIFRYQTISNTINTLDALAKLKSISVTPFVHACGGTIIYDTKDNWFKPNTQFVLHGFARGMY